MSHAALGRLLWTIALCLWLAWFAFVVALTGGW